MKRTPIDLIILVFVAVFFVAFAGAIIETTHKAHQAKLIEPEKMCRSIGRLEVKCP